MTTDAADRQIIGTLTGPSLFACHCSYMIHTGTYISNLINRL